MGCDSFKKLEPLIFNASPAYETSEKERVSICHSLQGNLNFAFPHKLENKEVIKLGAKLPSGYCNFQGEKLFIGRIDRKDTNECYTLTKAEVKRGAAPTYIETNSKYSPYKDKRIYWRCKYGSRPSYSETKVRTKGLYIYRYSENPDILLIRDEYFSYFYYKGDIFRRVSSGGGIDNYNTHKVIVTGKEHFNRGVRLKSINQT